MMARRFHLMGLIALVCVGGSSFAGRPAQQIGTGTIADWACWYPSAGMEFVVRAGGASSVEVTYADDSIPAEDLPLIAGVTGDLPLEDGTFCVAVAEVFQGRPPLLAGDQLPSLGGYDGVVCLPTAIQAYSLQDTDAGGSAGDLKIEQALVDYEFAVTRGVAPAKCFQPPLVRKTGERLPREDFDETENEIVAYFGPTPVSRNILVEADSPGMARLQDGFKAGKDAAGNDYELATGDQVEASIRLFTLIQVDCHSPTSDFRWYFGIHWGFEATMNLAATASDGVFVGASIDLVVLEVDPSPATMFRALNNGTTRGFGRFWSEVPCD